MARFSKTDVIDAMRRTGMVPIFYHEDIEIASNVLKACYEGGVRVFEFTNRGDFAHELFGELVKFAAAECPDMVLGAGSVVDAGTASIYIQQGANFIVAPLFNPDIAKTCNRRTIPYIPGCGSVSEIGFAQEAGCDVVKIFPAGSVGGPSFIKSIMAPMPWSLLMVTGGVEPTEANLNCWIQPGVLCVGIGSNLFPKEALEKNDWASVSRLCCESLCIISKKGKNGEGI